jgi:hypothetical protein
MITYPIYLIRHFRVDLKIIDEYVHRPTIPKPPYVRASETFRKLDIDPKSKNSTPPQTTMDKKNIDQ